MKKNLLFILLFACGFTFAQVGTNGDPDNPVSAYTDLEGFNQSDLGSQFIINNNDRPDVVLQSNNSRMALTTFSNRADFIAEACDLVDEDFEGSTCGFVCGCGGSIAGCYPGGALMPGFDITASFGAGTVVLTNGALGSNGSTIVGANTFAANTVIDFDPPVGSAGFDLAGTFFGSGNYNVAVSGAGGLIGNASVSTNQFVGVISDDEEITQIEISTISGWNGDLIDDLSFGLPCASGEDHCDPSDCLIVACPDDVTVDCIENYIADAENAIAVFNCTGDQGGGMSETFDFTGQVQTWTVPAGINVITINAFGAQGGSNAAGTSGADGGDASGTLIVTPGEVLQIYVGGMGSLTGGYNGGGNGGTTNCGNSVGGGGGGASDVRQGGNGLGNRVIVAAGGGGAGGQRNVGCGPGSGGAGGGGYYGGGGGGGYQGNPGQGGTQIGGGAGGTGNFGGGTGGTGTSGNGGNGGTAPTNNQGGTNPGPSGGGGGGLTGLAGGSGNPGWRGGGGGGGSSYVDGVIGGTTNSGVNTGDGMIEIVYGAGGGGACTETFRYFDTQPHQTGASNCPGTTYEIVYHVGDNCGNVGCCVQIVTIDNPPPTLTVTPGEVVSCYDDITVITGPLTSNDGIAFGDATVSTSCGEPFDLKILPPVVEGVHECPGTTYTYTYRLRDNCGREVTADRVFTIGSNDSPTIVSPPDITVPCGFNAELNPDYAEVTTGCTLGYTTVVTGPVISGVENCPGSTYTYTYTVTDDCGRSASDTRTFTIVNGPPVFLNCPSVPLQLNCEDEGWELVIQAWLASIEAESDCSAPLTVTNNYNPNTQGLCISNGTKTVRWFATDNCGRTSMCEGMVIIADTEPPLFVEAPQDELVVCNFITQDKLDAWVDANGYAEVFDCWDDNTISWTTSPNNPTINCAGNPGPTSITVEFIARDGCGNKSSMEATFTALPAIPSVGGSNEGAEGVEQLQLFQNQPNPFSDETSISFFLPEGGKATLSIFDVSGKLLQEIKGDYKQGMNVEEINSSDLQPGMLYYQISTATETATRRMILLD